MPVTSFPWVAPQSQIVGPGSFALSIKIGSLLSDKSIPFKMPMYFISITSLYQKLPSKTTKKQHPTCLWQVGTCSGKALLGQREIRDARNFLPGRQLPFDFRITLPERRAFHFPTKPKLPLLSLFFFIIAAKNYFAKNI